MKWPKAVAVTLLCCCLTWTVACSHSKASQDQKGGGAAKGGRGGTAGANGRPVPVGVATANKQDVPVILVGLGTITPYNTVTVRSRVDGQLVKINFKEGQNVHEGELLAVIDPRPYQVALQQAQAALARDQSLLRTSQLNLQRNQALASEGIVAQQQLNQQQAETGQYTGSVQLDEAAVENARLNLSYTQIKAPVNGRIGLRLVDIGNMVHAADQNGMLVITQMQPIAVIFTLPEDQIPQVVERMKSGSLPVQAYDRDDRTLLATGRLETLDNTIDPTTGTVRLKAIFDNKDTKLWPNQFVNAHLQLQTLHNVTVIPSSAIQHGQQNTDYVYLVDANNKVEMRNVKQQLTSGDLSVIAQGLNPGDRVVTDGQDRLQAGMQVEPTAPHPHTPAQNAAANPNAAAQPGSSPQRDSSTLPDANASPASDQSTSGHASQKQGDAAGGHRRGAH